MHIVIRSYDRDRQSLSVSKQHVDVWVASLRELPLNEDEVLGALTPSERQRAERYRDGRPRDQFARSRGLLRHLLGRYLAVDPISVPIGYDGDGKPFLEGEGGPRLHFNVSHTDGLAIMAVADCRVGIDVERIREIRSARGLIERFFAPEELHQYLRLEERLQPMAFLRGWTCKEAVLKGIGCGSRDLDRCVVELDPRQPPRILGPSTTVAEWNVAAWSPGEEYLAAIAVETDQALRLSLE